MENTPGAPTLSLPSSMCTRRPLPPLPLAATSKNCSVVSWMLPGMKMSRKPGATMPSARPPTLTFGMVVMRASDVMYVSCTW